MSDVTCRGSFALGTACGKCSRCRREVESYNAMKAVRDKLNTPSSSLSHIEELEANLSEQIEWVKQLADDLIAAEGREARLKEKLAKAVDVIEWALIAWDDHCQHGYNMQGDWVHDARIAIAELTGGKDE